MPANTAMMLGRPAGAAPPLQVNTFITSGGTSIGVPVGATSYTAEAIGGGGAGFGNSSNPAKAGGGGGRYAMSNVKIAVTPGQTVFVSVGAASQDSWVNYQTNAAPSSQTTGCFAPRGGAASSGTGGVGSFGTPIGSVSRNGGTGATGNGAVGGGGSGATTGGSGQTAGTDTTGLSASLMGGGTGGASLNAGTAPGGGGGSSATNGSNPAGAIGRCRVAFY